MANKPAKPQFTNLNQNQSLDAGTVFPVSYSINHAGGANDKAGGIAHVFNRVGNVPFQRFVKIEDKVGGGGPGARTLSITPVRGHSHTIRVLLWDRTNNTTSTSNDLSESKVQFRVK